MKTTSNKTIKALKVLKVIYTVVMIVLLGLTIYGMFFSEAKESMIDSPILAINAAVYCGLVCVEEGLQKAEAKKKEAEEAKEA